MSVGVTISERDDYYTRLGVPRDAAEPQIRFAFRQRAVFAHPARGGTHEQMVALLEAYDILSNETTRRRYDRVRNQSADPAALSSLQQNQSEARRRAENYPREWESFEIYLDAATAEPVMPLGMRMAAGAIGGALVGGTAGGITGHFMGIGLAMGAAIGAGLGAIVFALMSIKRTGEDAAAA